jgi:WD40 repeat protein
LLRACPQMPGPFHASLVFNSDGGLLASAVDKEVQVWDVASGEELARFAGLCDYDRRGLAFNSDGSRLAFPASENSVEVWDIRQHTRLTSYRGHQGPVTTIAFSPHGERVASGSKDQTFQVWDAANGRKVCNLKGTSATLATVVFSPDGTRLLATTSNKAVCVWDLEKGTEPRPLRGHKASVFGIAFNPTGTRLATAGADRVTRLWTWPDCEEILSLPVTDSPVLVGFVGDGKRLVTAGVRLTVWDTAPSPLSDRANE